MATVYTGEVKPLIAGKDFGFIKCEELGKDIFFHQKNLEGDLAVRKLKAGDKVKFQVEDTPKGANATKVELIEGE